MCQNLIHDFMALPATYPFEVREDKPGGVCAYYRCEQCGDRWRCWWSATGEEIAQWENEQYGSAA
jgi:hypothetical protein